MKKIVISAASCLALVLGLTVLSPQPMRDAILFAYIGGLILNLMPCVLPVISLKVLNFVSLAGEQQWKVPAHGLLFTLGVLVSFWALAGVLITLQAGGEAVGWGFQLQDARFVGAMVAVLFVLSLSLFGVFEFGVFVSIKAGQIQHTSAGLSNSFWNGVLATAVATPCTGPFLGPTLGYAVGIAPAQALLIFTFMGLGLATPYLVLSLFPAAIKILPKPGKWMLTFKQIMGFLMMGSAIWLTWVFIAQTDADATLSLLYGLLVLAVACWIYGRWAARSRVATILTLAFAGLGAFLVYDGADRSAAEQTAAAEWETYSDARLAQLRAAGQPAFIDFTAKWCLICQANKVPLSNDEVTAKFREKGVVRLRADWTKLDPEITGALARYGRNGVPLYVLTPADPNAAAIILPQTLTPGVILDALDSIDEKSRYPTDFTK